MATLKEPFALDRSLNTTEVTPRNIADVLAEGLSHITGRTASEVEYDNTDSGLTADNVQDALDEIAESVPTLPTTDIQTAVDEFETYNGGLLSECKVALSPNQDLHGYDNPWVGGAGKNKAEQTVAKIKSLNTSGTWSDNAYTWNGITYTILTDDANNVIGYDVDGTATARGWMFISDTDFGNDDIMYNGATRNGYTFTSGNPNMDGGYYCFYGWSQKKSWILVDVGLTKSHDKWYPMARFDTVADASFEPYSNICPITGHTQVEVDVSDGQTTQEQVTVNLGGTYYSGTLDVVTGEFVPDTASVDLGSLTWTYHDSSQVFYSADITDESRILAVTCDCEGFKPVTNKTAIAQMTEDGTVAFYSGDAYHRTYVKCSLYTDAITFKSAVSGIKLVYKLATPTPIQLSPTMVKALVGENHLSAPLEGQEITESKYKQMFTFDDVIAYIQSL